MSDSQPSKRRNLSEISHLFLSSVRDRQTNHAPRPVRKPPPRPDVSIDLTPEEFARAHAMGESVADDDAPVDDATAPQIAPLSAVIGAHLNGRQTDRVKDYARHLASGGQRVGLIEIDACEFRLSCFEYGGDPASAPPADPDAAPVDPRRIHESLYELNWDVDQWLLLLPNPRTSEARQLLRLVDHWTVLSTCDHDGVVSCYRMLKGLGDLGQPRLGIGVLDARDRAESARVFRKLSGVCQQFLGWDVQGEDTVGAAFGVVEYPALVYRFRPDAASAAPAPQWSIVSQFLAQARSIHQPVPDPTSQPDQDRTMNIPSHVPEPGPAQPVKKTLAEVVVASSVVAPSDPALSSPSPEPAPAPPNPMRIVPEAQPDPVPAPGADSSSDEIIDLPGTHADNATLLSAVLTHAAGSLVECPVRAPSGPETRLAVSRDGRLVLLAVMRQGLDELTRVGQAYRWLIENRALIAMAVPQLSICPEQSPELRLFVDVADRAAALLQPMLQSTSVTVQAYRKLTWHGKTGLLLEAA